MSSHGKLTKQESDGGNNGVLVIVLVVIVLVMLMIIERVKGKVRKVIVVETVVMTEALVGIEKGKLRVMLGVVIKEVVWWYSGGGGGGDGGIIGSDNGDHSDCNREGDNGGDHGSIRVVMEVAMTMKGR